MTLKELHTKLGDVMDKCPALADSNVCLADRSADFSDLNSEAQETSAVIVATDGSDGFYTVIVGE